MKQRINIFEKGQKALKAMYGLGSYLGKSSIEQHLQNLIYFRVSQINGCAYCLDMHSKDLRAYGESEQRLHVLSAWREAPFYTERERAALAFAEAVTNIKDGGVEDEVWEEARKHFSEEELIELTMALVAINGWNRINITFHAEAGSYKVGDHTGAKREAAAV